jgi:Fe-Mn family superoxide dismutase
LKVHKPETAKLHEEIAEAYKKRLGEIEDFEGDEEEKNTSFERSYLHNAIYLHNLWFEQIEGERKETNSPFLEEILERRESDLNTFIKWMNVFAYDAKPNGWAVWCWSYTARTFVGLPIKSHDECIPLGVTPLLVIDCWEHSYLVDYGLDFQSYLDVFWRELNWDKIEQRHKELAKLFGFHLK